ncbi:Zn-ribbon domain-containing OB-fold protein [Streptomyces sp. NPDC002659]|uniref:Zn-ribbon domain-containing OB-fold protein n=1 Tax=Streptomyces sp. NPDC002659 TaxID=3364656 RepID=UPI00367FCEEB
MPDHQSKVSMIFLDAAARGRLMLPRCGDCGKHNIPGDPTCAFCGSFRFDWVTVSGRGVLFSYAVVHHVLDASLAHEVPYVVALIRLEQGPIIVSRLVGTEEGQQPQVGAHVKVVYQVTGQHVLPVFTPTSHHPQLITREAPQGGAQGAANRARPPQTGS